MSYDLNSNHLWDEITSGVFEFAGVDSVDPAGAEEAKLVACRCCLVAERPLRFIEQDLITLYDQLTGTQLSHSEALPRYLCSYCWVLLLKFGKFRERCHLLQTRFIDLHYQNYSINLDTIIDVIDGESYPNLQISITNHVSIQPDVKENSCEDNVAQFDAGNTTNIARNYCNEDDLCSLDFSVDSDTLANLTRNIGKKNTQLTEIAPTKKVETENKKNHKSKKRNTRRCKKKELKKPFGYDVEDIRVWVDNIKSKEVAKEDDIKHIAAKGSNEKEDIRFFTDTTSFHSIYSIGSDYDISDHTNDNPEILKTSPEVPVKSNKAHKHHPTIKEETIKKPSQKKIVGRNKLSKKTSRKEVSGKGLRESQETLKAKKKDERKETRKLQHETNSNVKIVVLSKEEQIKQLQERKNTSNYTRALHKCEFCFRGFNMEYSYKNHMAKHELSEGQFRCDVCSMRYQSKLKLKKHEQAHHMYDFICNQCGFVSKSSADAGKHFRWHKGVKYDCKICGKTFDKPNSVMGHMHLSHGGTVTCDICQATFLGDKGLRSHMLLTHKEALGAVCSQCEVQFHSHNALERHGGSDGCQYHDGLRSCPACGEGFLSEELLQQHTKDHHKKGYVCETCGAHFNDDGKNQSKAMFEDHCRTHSGEKPFECHLCGKKFVTKQACRVHTFRHTAKKGVRVTHCRECNKSFTQNSNYKRHVRVVHQNLRLFTCDVCGAAYKDKYPLRIHVNTKHLGLPWPKRSKKRRANGDDAR